MNCELCDGKCIDVTSEFDQENIDIENIDTVYKCQDCDSYFVTDHLHNVNYFADEDEIQEFMTDI